MADLLPVADYVERILATVSPLPAFPQPLMEALGLALAEDVVAPISLPSFDNSAMDGYAVRRRGRRRRERGHPGHPAGRR